MWDDPRGSSVLFIRIGYWIFPWFLYKKLGLVLSMKSVPGYDGLYSATKSGRIWSHVSKKFLKQFLNNEGYPIVRLYKHKIGQTHRVHRLVLRTFIGESDLVCNHKNSRRTDNRLKNLEYVTKSENSIHGIKNGTFLIGAKRRIAKLSDEDVFNILFKESGRYSDIAKKYNVSRTRIVLIKQGKAWAHMSRGRERRILKSPKAYKFK